MPGGVRIALALVLMPGLVLAGLSGPPARAADEPGEFDYYTLALSWSPSWCETEGRGEQTPQCAGPRPYNFVLHGLWPQRERGWPEHCDTGGRDRVPPELIDSMLDIMPARGLVIHQYRKHGTCSGLPPAGYFALSRRLFETIRIPARYRAPEKPVLVSPRRVERDFLKANPALEPDMIAVACGRKGRLREVRICFSKDGTPTSCGANEAQTRLCKQDRLVMPPVRGR